MSERAAQDVREALGELAQRENTPGLQVARAIGEQFLHHLSLGEYVGADEDICVLAAQMTRERMFRVVEHPELWTGAVPQPDGTWLIPLEQARAAAAWLDLQQGVYELPEDWQQ